MLAVTLAARRPSTGAHAVTLGWLAGFVYFAGTLYWVVAVMQAYGGLQMWVAVLVGGLLWSYLALYVAVFAWGLWIAVRRLGLPALWLAPFLWVASEWARSTLVAGGFPWALLGSSQATSLPILQWASVAGVYGLSLLVAFVSAAAALLTLSRTRAHRAGAAAVGVAVVAIASWGAIRVGSATLVTSGRPTRIGLVQGSVDQAQKWDPRFRDAILAKYLALSRETIAAGAAAVIWPEAATPFFLDANAVLAAPIRRLAADTETPFIIGSDEIVRGSAGEPDAFYNAAVLIGGDGRSRGSYRKMRLVPFGEYVPLKRMLFFVGPLVEAVSDFSAGVDPVVFDANGQRMSVAICYELVYPWISRQFVARGSQLLTTITNDAWFGRSSAAYQHFDQAALRAVESARYVVRAANTGISGAVDPYGRVIARTDLFVPAAVTVDVRLLDARTIYSRAGDFVVWLSFVVVAWVAATRWTRRPRPILGKAPKDV